MRVHWVIPPEVSGEAARAITSILEEATTNALRHGEAGRIEVGLRRAPTLVVEVRDDGQGYDPDRVRRGNGMKSLAARVDLLGGTYQLAAAPRRGVRIRVEATASMVA